MISAAVDAARTGPGRVAADIGFGGAIELELLLDKVATTAWSAGSRCRKTGSRTREHGFARTSRPVGCTPNTSSGRRLIREISAELRQAGLDFEGDRQVGGRKHAVHLLLARYPHSPANQALR
ncbi:hypothetical protein FOS14_22280 [Skermania sp. ID1734]|uniref:hypothetical protein n=1 Tax=Skermania sp. ID1734 TaxID=2597516 RepID=UPI00117DE56F|nr:hypothetical protein [Skermania sp. ID1734]TSD93788.1 hypothetical protein FOS14_22280 [Skermania sp. ID1734]